MDPRLMAKNQSLQNLMGAMDDDEAKKIPGITISISLPEGMEANVEDGAQDQDDKLPDLLPPDEPEGGMDNPQAGAESSGTPGTGGSPFEELMKRKLAEKKSLGGY